jgi:hypothetical protein
MPEYTHAEIETIFRMREVERQSWRVIADAVGRSTGHAVRNCYERLELERMRDAEADRRALLALNRPCLACGAWLLSEHAGHRMCDGCRDRSGISEHGLACVRLA